MVQVTKQMMKQCSSGAQPTLVRVMNSEFIDWNSLKYLVLVQHLEYIPESQYTVGWSSMFILHQ